jgi:hypothetical protein
MKVKDFSSLSYRFSVRLYRNAKFFHRTAGSDDAFRKCPPPETQKIPRRAQVWGDRIFEKCGIRRDEGGDGGKTLEIRGKRRLSARDGGANYQQS